MNNSILLFLQ